jgi:CBS domain-containing protein
VSALPVVDGDTVLGVVGVRQLQRLPRNRWANKHASDLMVVPPAAPLLAPTDELWPAVELMNRIGVDGLAVVVDGRLDGMVMRESIGALMLRRGAERDAGGPDPRTGEGASQ